MRWSFQCSLSTRWQDSCSLTKGPVYISYDLHVARFISGTHPPAHQVNDYGNIWNGISLKFWNLFLSGRSILFYYSSSGWSIFFVTDTIDNCRLLHYSSHFILCYVQFNCKQKYACNYTVLLSTQKVSYMYYKFKFWIVAHRENEKCLYTFLGLHMGKKTKYDTHTLKVVEVRRGLL